MWIVASKMKTTTAIWKKKLLQAIAIAICKLYRMHYAHTRRHGTDKITKTKYWKRHLLYRTYRIGCSCGRCCVVYGTFFFSSLVSFSFLFTVLFIHFIVCNAMQSNAIRSHSIFRYVWFDCYFVGFILPVQNSGDAKPYCHVNTVFFSSFFLSPFTLSWSWLENVRCRKFNISII